jgi:hypothetical protein
MLILSKAPPKRFLLTIYKALQERDLMSAYQRRMKHAHPTIWQE